MRAALAAALLASVLLAGCSAQVDAARSQLDDVRGQLDEARAGLEAAQQEAREAKDRLDRVRSLTALREEKLDLVVRGVFNGDNLLFEVERATRSNGEQVPAENLTRLPLLALESDAANGTAVLCDPLTCQVYFPHGRSFLVYWLDDESRVTSLTRPACADPDYCDDPRIELSLPQARVWATTSAGDATG